METKKGKLVILSAPSGCGKTTVSEQLIKDPMIVHSVSATTRTPRPGEKNGVDYFFLSTGEFKKLINEDRFIEYAEYHENFYGTLIDPVNESISKGLKVLLIIETNGALQVMKKYPDCISIFLLPPSIDVLRERLTGRKTESTDEIKERLGYAKKEIEEKHHYDYYVVNDDLDKAVSEIKDIIDGNHTKV